MFQYFIGIPFFSKWSGLKWLYQGPLLSTESVKCAFILRIVAVCNLIHG